VAISEENLAIKRCLQQPNTVRAASDRQWTLAGREIHRDGIYALRKTVFDHSIFIPILNCGNEFSIMTERVLLQEKAEDVEIL